MAGNEIPFFPRDPEDGDIRKMYWEMRLLRDILPVESG
jgi:hypothetical protein